MEKINRVKDKIMMKIEDPFWNGNFNENLPKWIHIWVVTIGLGCGILFIFNTVFDIVNGNNPLVKIIAIMGLICLTLIICNRDTYLPFLSENFVPEPFLKLDSRIPKKIEKTINIKVDPNTTVLYWAADPGNEIKKNWKEGYSKFENSGIVKSDISGNVGIPIECPNRYIVHGYKILPKHVHYRTYNKNTQMLSRIQTIVLTSECS
jgi:hypothetical protein